MARAPSSDLGLASEDAEQSPSLSVRPRSDDFVPGREAIEATLSAIGASLAGATFTYKSAETPASAGSAPSTLFESSSFGGAFGSDDSGSRTDAPPIQLARSYQPIEEIGRGGMGIVYRTRQTVLHREIAVKATKFTSDGIRAIKFISEALITASLQHPNIIPVYDLTSSPDQRLALAMKLVSGTTWHQRLTAADRRKDHGIRYDPTDMEYHLDVFMSVANALAFAHSKEIAHCDVKPSNVLLGEFGEVLLVDWGIAVDFAPEIRVESPAPHRSSVRTPCGTPKYMAPELARGDGEAIGPWTDVFLLGAILYELLSGAAPHQGHTAAQALWRAASWQGLSLTDSTLGDHVPEMLVAICARAMAPAPSDRYQSVTALQDDIRAFRERQQSLLITERADEKLAACIDRAPQVDAGDGSERNRLYSQFAEAVAGFREARALWPQNPSAIAGERNARIAFAERALTHNDLGLAEAQLELLSADEPDARTLRSAVADAQRARTRARTQTRWLWTALALAALALITGLGVAYALIEREHSSALASRDLAEQRLADIRRLADAQHVLRLQRESQALWPAVPAGAPQMSAWLDDARALVARLPDHEHHLAELRRHATPSDRAASGYRFRDSEEQWEHDNLLRLVDDIQGFRDQRIPEMERRVGFARSVYERSITAHQRAWTEARQAIANSSLYPALDLEPQLGLVPIGPDPKSGLWEFAHIQTGEIPTRAADGNIERSEAMGIVLVLLPGGPFSMGAQSPSAQHPLGSPNVDPGLTASESPVHTVTLDPFFLAKYELTQGQWYRFTDHNPSAYPPGKEVGGRVHSALHPVEMIRWQESFEFVSRLALTLPTEAQWEYAVRAGTTTIYPTGDDKLSLRGALNIADAYCRGHGGPGSWQYETWLDDGYVVHAAVGSYRANAFGLHDMVGNVWEWCLDRFGSYELPVRPGDGERQAPPDAPHVFRGGGFRANAVHARSADRYSLYTPEYRGYDVGMRPARRLTRAAADQQRPDAAASNDASQSTE